MAVASGGIFLAQVRGTGTVLLRVSRAQTPLRASRGEPAPPARGTPATCTSLARAPAASPDSSWHGAGATRSAAAGALPGARERSRSREWLQWRLPRGQARWSGTRRAVRPPPPPPRTKWTRRVPHPVLIGHARVPLAVRGGACAGGGCACTACILRGCALALRSQRQRAPAPARGARSARRGSRAARVACARDAGGGARGSRALAEVACCAVGAPLSHAARRPHAFQASGQGASGI